MTNNLGQLLGDLEDPNSSTNQDEFLSITAKNILRILLQDWKPNWPTSILSLKFIKLAWSQYKSIYLVYRVLFEKHDPSLLKMIRNEIEALLKLASQQKNQITGNTQDEKTKFKLSVKNLLALYVMFEPQDGNKILIPKIHPDNSISPCECTIKQIELTPKDSMNQYKFKNKHRVYSYGFTPTNDKNTPSLLVHCGTGWDTAQGVETQILTNLKPYTTVGETLYLWGKDQLNEWIKEQKQVEVMGQSLGGALAYLTAFAHPKQVTRVDALNPPALFKTFDTSHPVFGEYFKEAKKPEIHIQRQHSDPCKNLGKYLPEWKLLKLTPTYLGPDRPLRWSFSHLRNLAANQSSTIKYDSADKYNNSYWRTAGNNLVYFGRAFILPLISQLKNTCHPFYLS